MSEQLRRWSRWLVPGLGIKRWVAILALGIVLISAGAALIANTILMNRPAATIGAGTFIIFAGIFVVLIGLRGTLRAIDRVIFPTGTPTLVEVLREQRTLSRGPKIVALGGGTGLSTLLRGLKRYSSNITAVVTVFDDGGSSGRLRRDLGILPPGDIRDCLVALAEAEPQMTRLFEYRFPSGALDGHAFGNLFLASLSGVTGDLVKAVQEASKVLKIRGRVLPSTLMDVVLCAEHTDGTLTEGESQIPLARKPIGRVFLRPADAEALPEVLAAIAEADLILIGPGSLFTSVIPNLLVGGVAGALARAAAPRVYICNVMTQPGETEGFTARDHVTALVRAAGTPVFTHVLLNTQSPANVVLRRRYEAEGSRPVPADLDGRGDSAFATVAAALISEEELLRHDPERLAAAVMRIAEDASAKRPRASGLSAPAAAGPAAVHDA